MARCCDEAFVRITSSGFTLVPRMLALMQTLRKTQMGTVKAHSASLEQGSPQVDSCTESGLAIRDCANHRDFSGASQWARAALRSRL